MLEVKVTYPNSRDIVIVSNETGDTIKVSVTALKKAVKLGRIEIVKEFSCETIKDSATDRCRALGYQLIAGSKDSWFKHAESNGSNVLYLHIGNLEESFSKDFINELGSIARQKLSGKGSIIVTGCNNVSDMTRAFSKVGKLDRIDLRGANLSKLKVAKMMFSEAGSHSPTGPEEILFNRNIKIKPTNMYAMFLNCAFITDMDLSMFDTSQVASMSSMFYGCSSLESIDLSMFDTSRVTNMSSMFSGCRVLKHIDLSSFDFRSVKYAGNMFANCSELVEVDLSKHKPIKLEVMDLMFEWCISLKVVKMFDFSDTEKLASAYKIFRGCYNIKYIDMSSLAADKIMNCSWGTRPGTVIKMKPENLKLHKSVYKGNLIDKVVNRIGIELV